jgi:hypothetical protein
MGFRRDPRQSRRANFSLPAFTPKALASLTLWLRADLGFTAGLPTWTDQSGSGNAVTGGGLGHWSLSASGGPNGTACIVGAAASETLANGSWHPVTGSAFTVYVVHKFASVAAYSPFTLGSATPVSLGETAAPLRNFTIGANTQTGGSATASFELWIYQATSGGTQSLRVNGSSASLSGNIAAATPDAKVQFLVGGGNPAYSIAEIAISNSAPGATDVANFEAYALARYGL